MLVVLYASVEVPRVAAFDAKYLIFVVSLFIGKVVSFINLSFLALYWFIYIVIFNEW